MAQIEINKDEVLSAINVFNAAISEFESATDVFMDAAGNLDGQNSDFVNQMKSMVDDLTKLVNKEVPSKVTGYRDAVKGVVEGMNEADEQAAREVSKSSASSQTHIRR